MSSTEMQEGGGLDVGLFLAAAPGDGGGAGDGGSPTPPFPSTWVRVVAPLLFGLAWLGMAFRWPFVPRIGRTLSTLVVAVLCVATGCLTGPEAFAAVNLDTLALLFGTMIMAALLEREGFFRNVQKLWCLRIPNGRGRAAHHLLFRVVLSSGLLSALFTNDSWCVVGTPVLLRLCARFRLPYAPFLIALATSANIGSACSPVGNPQNMLIASASGLSFTTFLKFLLLPTVICLLLNALALMLVYNTQLHGHTIMWTEAHLEREDDDGAKKLQHGGPSSGSRRLTIDLDDDHSTGALRHRRAPSPRSAVRRRHSGDESGVDDGTNGRVVRVRKLSVSEALATAANSNEVVEHTTSVERVEEVQPGSPEARRRVVIQLTDTTVTAPAADATAGAAHDADHDNPFLALDVAASTPLSSQQQLPQNNHGFGADTGHSAATDAASEHKSDHSPAHSHSQPPARPRPHPIPSAYPDLDLTQEWARCEYIRRCQLAFFYHRTHQENDAANSHQQKQQQQQDQAGNGSPAPAPPLSYVASPRYAPPAQLPDAHTNEAAAAATARARAAGLSPPPPQHSASSSAAAASSGADDRLLEVGVDIPPHNDAAAGTVSATFVAPSSARGNDNNNSLSSCGAHGGRLVMQPPSYSSLRFPISPPPPPRSALQRWLSRHSLPFHAPAKVHQFSVVLLGTLIAFLAGVPLAWASLGGALAMLLLDGVDPDATGLWVGGGVDWALLIFFSALFIVVESLRRSGWPEKAWDGAAPYLDVTTGLGVFLYALLIVVGSNTVSNVPLVLILSPSLRALSSPDARHRSWLLLAFVSTLAGNLTLVGSVANLIVVARARPWYNLGFVEYVKYGFLSTLVFITLGVALLGLELS